MFVVVSGKVNFVIIGDMILFLVYYFVVMVGYF